MKTKQKFYVVWKGRKPGVYNTWNECQNQVYGYTNARYKSFTSKVKAERAYLGIKTRRSLPPRPVNKPKVESRSYVYLANADDPITPCICVDGAWNSASKVFEYRVIEHPSEEVLLEHGPFPGGTNNIAEFLALVAGIRYCYANLIDWPIYTDSMTALAWLRRKKANTKRSPHLIPQDVQEALKDAEDWLENDSYVNKILKWRTDLWGENPADFGRKS